MTALDELTDALLDQIERLRMVNVYETERVDNACKIADAVNDTAKNLVGIAGVEIQAAKVYMGAVEKKMSYRAQKMLDIGQRDGQDDGDGECAKSS